MIRYPRREERRVTTGTVVCDNPSPVVDDSRGASKLFEGGLVAAGNYQALHSAANLDVSKR